MTLSAPEQPSEKDVAEIMLGMFGEPSASIQRFSTGIGHWVYEARIAGGAVRVVKLGLASQRDDFVGAVHWSTTLRPLGVPLPELIAHGEHRGLPYLVLERLYGEDLACVYSRLSSSERKTIAEQVFEVQQAVATIPAPGGYGFARIPGDQLRSSWRDVVEASIARSRRRMEAVGAFDLHWADRVSRAAERFSAYFSQVPPGAFLDDVTTKNVLVHERRFSGIVDVDWVCFGDPLFTVALTRAAILNAGHIPDYTDHWCRLLGVMQEQCAAVRFYTALFCLDFMGEVGQVFNRGVEPLAPERVARLKNILEEHLRDAP
jgi:aminoglycoside phosphotransferase